MEEDKDQYFSSLVRKGNKIHMMYGNKKVWCAYGEGCSNNVVSWRTWSNESKTWLMQINE